MIATRAWSRVRAGVAKGTTHDEGLRRVALRLAAQTVVLLLLMLVVLEAVVYIVTQHTLLRSLENTVQARAVVPDPNACRLLNLMCGFRPGGPPNGSGANTGQAGFPARGTAGTGGPAGGSGRTEGQNQPGTGSGVIGSANGSPAGQRGQFGSGAGPGGQPSGSVGAGRSGPGFAIPEPPPSDASAVYVNQHLRWVHADGIISKLLDRNAAQAAVTTHTSQCCSVHNYSGQDYLVYTLPLFHPDGTVAGAVQTSISEHQYEGTMRNLLQILLLVALLGLIGSGGVSVVLTRRALQPIRLSLQRQRDFVADAAHELRTPLAIMRTVGEVGLNGAGEEDPQATIEQMLAENRHLTRLVDDLSLLARADSAAISLQRTPLDLSNLVTETAGELQPLAEEQGVRLEVDAQAHLQVSADVLRLRQLLLILLDNALKHTPAGGHITVSLHAQSGRARLQVADSGPGIDPIDLPHIFDRFYRANKARTGEGSGLGLAIGRWIVEAHGGHIEAANASHGGAVFTVSLPLMRSGAPTSSG